MIDGYRERRKETDRERERERQREGERERETETETQSFNHLWVHRVALPSMSHTNSPSYRFPLLETSATALCGPTSSHCLHCHPRIRSCSSMRGRQQANYGNLVTSLDLALVCDLVEGFLLRLHTAVHEPLPEDSDQGPITLRQGSQEAETC